MLRTPPQEQHASFVGEHERKDEHEARQRHPRQRPVAVGSNRRAVGKAVVVGRSGRSLQGGLGAAEIGIDLVQQAVELFIERGRLAPVTIPAIIV
jgi:hypothetical protein